MTLDEEKSPNFMKEKKDNQYFGQHKNWMGQIDP